MTINLVQSIHGIDLYTSVYSIQTLLEGLGATLGFISGGTRGVMVIIVGNGHNNTSSNSG